MRIIKWLRASIVRQCFVVLAVIGVACGMAPYFAAAKCIVLLLAGETAFAAYLPWR